MSSWKGIKFSVLLLLLAVALPVHAEIFEWSTTELQLQYGRYEVPFTGETTRENGFVYTFQHADGWKYGDNFMFVDYSDYDDTGTDLYGEFYANFSLGKITGKEIGFWRVKDIGIIAGINYGREAELLKYLPGFRLSWDLPGFAFLNSDFTLYIDDNGGPPDGIPKEDNSYMVDINWAAPFTIGKQRFSIEGHVEYIGRRDNEFGDKVSWHVLGQPQFRWDLGNAWFGEQDKLFVGIEWQFWLNKNDDPDTDESAPQLLAVWRF
jgi:nucleoside-specific outer membrane channel protein Tsx